MATGYVVSGRGDLDVLFAPRTLAAGANTGFKSNGGVDLAQRFEQRGSVTAIADTGLKSGATDLAQTFLDIASTTVTTRSLVTALGGSVVEYTSGQYGTAAFGTLSPSNLFYAWRIVEIAYWPGNHCRLSIGNDAGPPPDADSTWNSLGITGVFADSAGATVTRTMTRSSASSSTSNSFYRTWFYGTSAFQLITGNTYSVTLTKV